MKAGPLVAGVFALVWGCSASTPREASQRITLTYWSSSYPAQTTVARLLTARWNAEHPDIYVRVQPIAEGRSSEEIVLAAVVANATPDVYSNVTSALLRRLVDAHCVLRLDRLAATRERLSERASPAMRDSLRLEDGGIYMLPLYVSPVMLFYNVDQLAAAGVKPPRTHRELLEAMRRLARDTDGDGRLDHWALWVHLTTRWWDRYSDFYPLYLSGSSGRTLLDQGKIAFDRPAAVSALEILRRGFAEHLLPRTNFAGRDPFLDGTVAMHMEGPVFLFELAELKNPNLRFDVTPIPRPDDVDEDAAYAFSDRKSFSIFASTRHPEEAARFVAYMTSPEADRLLISEVGYLPYRQNLAEDSRFSSALDRWPTLSTFARNMERTRDLDVHRDSAEILDIISEAYEAAAIYGTITPEKAIHDAAEEAREVIHAR